MAFVFEGMQRADWHVREGSRLGHDALAIDSEGDFAFENVEGFFFAAMGMGRGAAAGRDDRFPHGVIVVGFCAGGEEAVDVSDDGDGFAFDGWAEGGWGGGGHWSVIPVARRWDLGLIE